MNILASLGILLLSMLIMGFLDLTPGVFSLFCHYKKGQYSKKKASDLSMFFILGNETVASCIFLCVFFLVSVSFFFSNDPTHTILSWIASGVLMALAVVTIFFYYRSSKTTELFISRKFAKTLDFNAQIASTRSDAFTLGALSSISELIFTLPLYIITAMELTTLNVPHLVGSLLTIIYIATPTIPLFIIKIRFQNGHNLADITRSRFRNKNFNRFLIGSCYVLIAILIIYFRAL